MLGIAELDAKHWANDVAALPLRKFSRETANV